jgi:hypothetical protein
VREIGKSLLDLRGPFCRFSGARMLCDVTGEIHAPAVVSARFRCRLRDGGICRERLPLLDSGCGADCAAEAKIGGRPLPLGGLDRYARYYAGTIDSGRRFIRGKLVPARGNEAPGIHIVEGRMLPLQGEGCVANSEPGGGPWLYLRCAHPGAWTPNDGQIAELEGGIPSP